MYTFDSRIRYSEIDYQGKLSMASLLNYFQDCSTFHSEDIGLGVEYLSELKLAWVMSAWQIVVNRYPKLGEKVTIGTYPYEFKRFLGMRNFILYGENGEVLAKANSIWTLLNIETGVPTLPTEDMIAGYGLEEKLDMDYAPRKIAVPEGGEKKQSITVELQHLDTNHHVNNGQYVNMALGFLPEDFEIAQLRAEYKKQAFLGDELHPYVVNADNKYIIALTDAEDNPYVIVELLKKENG